MTPQAGAAYPQVSVSIVSHGQMGLVAPLLRTLQERAPGAVAEIILTLNLPEPVAFDERDFGFPIRILRNVRPLGFGANHNQAAQYAQHALFCILNPDIRLEADPFGRLAQILDQHPDVALVAPRVTDGQGHREDNARYFPTVGEILGKCAGGRSRTFDSGAELIGYPDWVGGMFMLTKRDVFRAVGGFDEAYHLYYEDVDLCARLRAAGYKVAVADVGGVIHEARRASHRQLKYALWHLKSMCRYFAVRAWRVPRGGARRHT